MKFPSKGQVNLVMQTYPPGTRVELVSMDDPYTDLMPGSLGTVDFVDDTGAVHVNWDSGSRLGVVYGVDAIKPVSGTESINEKVAALYCRSAGTDSNAVEMQKAMLLRYADEQGYKNPAIYEDIGYSGLSFANRPGFTAMQNDIAAGKIRTVIAKNESRISRNTIEFAYWVLDIEEKGVSFTTPGNTPPPELLNAFVCLERGRVENA